MIMEKLLRFWLVGMVLLLTSCDIAVDIFKGGMWVGAVLVLLILGAVVWIFSKFR
jgi:hypothetical protein